MTDIVDEIIQAAADKTWSDIAKDEGEHCEVAAAVLRVLAASLDSQPPREMIPAQVIRAVLRQLADELDEAKRAREAV